MFPIKMDPSVIQRVLAKILPRHRLTENAALTIQQLMVPFQVKLAVCQDAQAVADFIGQYLVGDLVTYALEYLNRVIANPVSLETVRLAPLKYLTAEILEVSNKYSAGQTIITNVLILMGIFGDAELSRMFSIILTQSAKIYV